MLYGGLLVAVGALVLAGVIRPVRISRCRRRHHPSLPSGFLGRVHGRPFRKEGRKTTRAGRSTWVHVPGSMAESRDSMNRPGASSPVTAAPADPSLLDATEVLGPLGVDPASRGEAQGPGAWLAWVGLHIVMLVGHRNRLATVAVSR
jgi:hypothetical protein